MFGPYDGKRVSVPPYRRMMMFLMRGRNESAVYFEQTLDLSRTLPWLKEWNAAHPGKHATVFHLFMHVLAAVLHERPRLNRFTVGRRTYQRRTVQLSFAAKKAKSDDQPLRTIKRAFPEGQSFEQVVDVASGEIDGARTQQKTAMDKELGLLLWMPGFLLAFLLGALKRLYAWGLAPKSLVETDPLYTSAFLANLGSIGLDAAYHHLYEHGNCPLFITLGRVDGDRLTIKYSYDERVEDGLYCARSLQILKARIEDPTTPSPQPSPSA